MEQERQVLAVCGLECHVCDIFKAKSDPELALRIAEDLARKVNEEVNPESIRCTGCRGNRDENSHWSQNCWILECCIDERGLEFCSECEDFACDRLIEWAKRAPRYSEALERLRAMKKA